MTIEELKNHIFSAVIGESGMAQVSRDDLESLACNPLFLDTLMGDLTWDIGCYILVNMDGGYSFVRDPNPDACRRFAVAYEEWLKRRQCAAEPNVRT
jgi:hypothetical protein